MTDASEQEFVTHNEQPRPRVLVAWDGPSRKAIEAILDVSAGFVQVVDDLGDVRQSDFDVLVCDALHRISGSQSPAAHLCVLWTLRPVDARTPTEGRDHMGRYGAQTVVGGHVPRHSISLRVSIDPQHSTFANLLPALREVEEAISPHRTIGAFATGSASVPSTRLEMLISTADGDPIAATYRRSTASEGVVLPPHTPHLDKWVEVCLRRWATMFGQFPIVGGWMDEPRWMTVQQEAVAAEKVAAEEGLRRTTERLTLRIEDLEKRVEDEQARAILGPRRLLEEKGDALVDAAIEALRTLGYEVTDLDAGDEPADGAGKGEDLRITDPDAPEFDPVVEVKGYDKGAKGSEIGKVVRHKVRAEAAGRTTDATWWIVNHNRTMAPDERPMAFRGEDAMIARESRPENCGLVVIDTRDLFLAAKAVEGGMADASAVRASLRSASGRWAGLPDDR